MWVVSILRHFAAFIDWTNEELMLLLMTKKKLLLRSLFLTANRTRVRKFPRTILIASNIKAMYHAIPSTSEGRFGMNVDGLLGTMVVDMFFIVPVFHKMYKKIRTLSAQTQSIKKLEFR